MLRTATKWGLIIGGLASVISTTGYAIFPLNEPTTFALAEYTGYTGVIVAVLLLLLVYPDYEKTHQKQTGALRSILLGIGVTLMAGLVFGAYNVVYANVLVRDFLDQYHSYKLAHTGLESGPEFEAIKAQIAEEKALLQTPVFAFFAMASAVWVVGLVFSLILPFTRRIFRRRVKGTA